LDEEGKKSESKKGEHSFIEIDNKNQMKAKPTISKILNKKTEIDEEKCDGLKDISLDDN